MRLQKRIAAALLAAALMTVMLTACSDDGSHVTGGGNSGGSTGGNSPGISSGSEGGSKGDESGTVPKPEENPVYRIEKYNARHQSKTYTYKETVIEDTGGTESSVGRTFITVSDGIRLAQYDITKQFKDCTIMDTKANMVYTYLDFVNEEDRDVYTYALADGAKQLANAHPSVNYTIQYYGYGGAYGKPLKVGMQEVNHTTCYCETIMDEDVMLSGNRTYCFAPDDKEGMKLLYVVEVQGQHRTVYKIDQYTDTVNDWSLLQVPEGYELWEGRNSDAKDTGTKTKKDRYPNN